MRARIACIAAVALVLGAPSAADAAPVGDADVAALQVGLAARSLYDGNIDGYAGPQTLAALNRLPGATTALAPATRAALGGFGAHPLGSRPLVAGTSGWDVAALRVPARLARLPLRRLPRRHLRRAHQGGALASSAGRESMRSRWRGPQTLAALRQPPPASPVRLSAPIDAEPTDGFGPRGTRFHTGIDYPAPMGTPVVAARDGVVSAVGSLAGYGNVVELSHGQGVSTLYAHLSRILVEPGRRVTRGTTVGLVGRTGDATGPHLHFELRIRGAAIDPAGALG